MDNSRELARLLASTIGASGENTTTVVGGHRIFRGEEVQSHRWCGDLQAEIIIHVDAERPADDTGKPIGKLCHLN